MKSIATRIAFLLLHLLAFLTIFSFSRFTILQWQGWVLIVAIIIISQLAYMRGVESQEEICKEWHVTRAYKEIVDEIYERIKIIPTKDKSKKGIIN